MTSKLQNTLMGLAILLLLIVMIKYFASTDSYIRSTTKYKNFGIRIPNGYSVHGIDVSRYQRGVNWELVKDMRDKGVKIEFAFMKCCEGTYLVDKTYNINWREAKEQGILCGAYMYFHPDKNVTTQVNLFKKHAKIKSGDFAPVIDIEETKGVSNATLQSRLKECIDQLEAIYNCQPIIYCNSKFYENHIGEKFDDYPLWVANYYVAKPGIGRDWGIWQHNDKGNVNGIDGHVDFNVAEGSMWQLKRLCIP